MPDQSPPDKSIPTLAAELWELVRAYVLQETVEPIKGMARDTGRFVVFGVAGSFLLGIGLILLAVALLRALQTETGDLFDGNLSVLPYLATLLACAIVAGLAVAKMGKRGSRA